ncbi:sporulation protein YunB [Peribacillus tepidiphilus]|uniref:sporulation protein YunB n=1 Tax=Peribacillus tepidiphilus TaxID=2652445 RepID=UPI0017870503|nr:sporulation protein YunB [Peribacillus tepidiphilus]
MGFFRRKGRSRLKGPLPIRYVFLLTFVFFFLSTAGGLFVINKGIQPTLMNYAESQTRKIASLVISNAINKKIANVIDLNDIIEIVPNNNNGTSKIKFNTEIINRVNTETVNLVLMNLKEAEQGNLSSLEYLTDVEMDLEEGKKAEGIVFFVPLGQATNNALLGNLGPKIPVKFNAIGDVRSNVIPKVKPYGINNAYVEIIIHIEVNVQIIIPFATEVYTITQDIPVAMVNIEGQVPQFYNGGGDANPSFELPSNP